MSANALDDPVTPFAPLRQALAAQQAVITGRIAALDDAEEALARLAEAFGMPIAAQQKPVEREGAVSGLAVPAEPPEAAPPRPAAELRACQECGEPFEPTLHAGRSQKFCSKRCRQRHHNQRLVERQREARKAANGHHDHHEAAVEVAGDAPFVSP